MHQEERSMVYDVPIGLDTIGLDIDTVYKIGISSVAQAYELGKRNAAAGKNEITQ
jgi:hypothetical protein